MNGIFLSIVTFYRLLQLFHDVIVIVNNNTNIHSLGQLAWHSSFTMYHLAWFNTSDLIKVIQDLLFGKYLLGLHAGPDLIVRLLQSKMDLRLF
jgi:hypothetical protein